MIPKGLFWRSLIILLVPLVLLQGVVTYIFFERHWETVSRHLALGLSGDIIYVMRTIQKYPQHEFKEWTLQTAQREMQINAVYVVGEKLPNIKPKMSNRNMERMLYTALSERLIYPFHLDTRRNDKNISVQIELEEGLLTIITPRKRMFSTTVYVFVVWMLGTSLVVAAISIFFLRNQIQPIRLLATAAEAFGKGQFIDFKPSGSDEVRRAGVAFLAMRARIERQIKQRTQMLSGVSHDLRTPLTRLKLQLAMLEKKETANKMAEDIDEMEKMLNDYLQYAKSQTEEKSVNFSLTNVIVNLLKKYEPNKYEFYSNENFQFNGRENLVKRCILNVLENGLTYGNKIFVEIKKSMNSIIVTVEDNGSGIPKSEYANIFKPFYRIDKSRGLNKSGVGLGLSVAQDIAKSHGGSISLSESKHKGLLVKISLPF